MTEAYKVGITIALTNKISSGLMMIRGDLAKTDAQALALHATLGKIKKMGLIGAAVGGAGFLGLEAIKSGYEAAKKYEQALSQFKALNLGDAVNKDADKFARGSSVIGASAIDLIGTVKELHTVLNNYGESKMLAPMIAQMEYANKAVDGGKGTLAFNEGQRQMLGKVLEYRGGFKSEAEMRTQADYMQHVMSGTGFMVMPRDYRNVLARGGIAAQQMSNEAFYYKNEPLVQMMGGDAVGTGLRTSYGRMVFGTGAGGPGGKAYIELLDQLGLVKKGMIEHNNHTGKITKVAADFLKDTELYKIDAYAFLEQKLVPAMRAAGFSEGKIETSIAQIYGNTGGKVMNQAHAQFKVGKLQGKVATDEKAMGVQELLKLAKTSPQGAEEALGKAFENLRIAAGEVLIPIVIPALLRFAEGIRTLGRWIDQHPLRFKWLILGFAGLSAALLFSGTVLLLKASFLGLNLAMNLLAPNLAKSISPIGALATKLGLLGVAAYGVYDLINNHKQYADAIDKAAPEIGDKLYRFADNLHDGPLRNFLFGGNAPAKSITPPPSSGKPLQISTQINLDGRPIAQVVTQHQAKAANAPFSSGQAFDGRLNPGFGY